MKSSHPTNEAIRAANAYNAKSREADKVTSQWYDTEIKLRDEKEKLDKLYEKKDKAWFFPPSDKTISRVESKVEVRDNKARELYEQRSERLDELRTYGENLNQAYDNSDKYNGSYSGRFANTTKQLAFSTTSTVVDHLLPGAGTLIGATRTGARMYQRHRVNRALNDYGARFGQGDDDGDENYEYS